MLTPPTADPLRSALVSELGAGSVVFDPVAMTPYTTDVLRAKAARPRLVVRPADTLALSAAVRVCAAYGATIVPFGGNTGFCGGSMADDGGQQVVVSLARMNRVREIDLLNNTMTVEAGCILAELQALALENDRVFPLSHGGEGSAQIGGCLSTNAGGNAVLRFGMARDLVLGLEVVLPDGRVLDALRGLRKDNAGYDLKQIFLGTEGTLGIIGAAVLKLYPRPQSRETALVAVSSVPAAVRLLAHTREHVGDVVTACELLPRLGLELFFETAGESREPFATPHAWQVLIELESGSRHFRLRDAIEDALGEAIAQGLAIDAVLAESEAQRASLWKLREGIAVAAVSDPSSLKNDQSVPCSKIAEFVDAGYALIESLAPGARGVPFGHIGDGNIHFNVWRPGSMSGDAFRAHWPALVAGLEDLATRLGGSIAAEHGIGASKRAALARVKDEVALDLMRQIKRAIDPQGRLNPGKVVP